LPPLVQITRFAANGETVKGEGARLPAGTSRIQLEFAALSLIDAKQNRFRVKLEGADADWVDINNQREASYLGLRPGQYTFRVIAANSDGVWNTEGASLTFSIAPYFWQTWWFRTLAALLALAVVGAMVRWRFLVATAQTRLRVEAQLGERERIARDIHDTLLQGFQGLMLRFQAAVQTLPPTDAVRAELETVLEMGDDVLIEGRDRIGALRRDAKPVDLCSMITPLAQRVLGSRFDWDVDQQGEPRLVCAPVADEIYQIASEAFANVDRHSGARDVRVLIKYGHDALMVEVLDDGVGLPPAVRETGSKEGHYGLVGMRERAAQIGGAITVLNRRGGGCQVRLTIPSAVAYA
jgi:signal transduction histidine kinase